jgi:hypothetical protein
MIVAGLGHACVVHGLGQLVTITVHVLFIVNVCSKYWKYSNIVISADFQLKSEYQRRVSCPPLEMSSSF